MPEAMMKSGEKGGSARRMSRTANSASGVPAARRGYDARAEIDAEIATGRADSRGQTREIAEATADFEDATAGKGQLPQKDLIAIRLRPRLPRRQPSPLLARRQGSRGTQRCAAAKAGSANRLGNRA